MPVRVHLEMVIMQRWDRSRCDGDVGTLSFVQCTKRRHFMAVGTPSWNVDSYPPSGFLGQLSHGRRLRRQKTSFNLLPAGSGPRGDTGEAIRLHFGSRPLRPSMFSSCSLVGFLFAGLVLPLIPLLLIQVNFDGGRAVVTATDGKIRQFLAGRASIRAATTFTKQFLARLFRCFSTCSSWFSLFWLIQLDFAGRSAVVPAKDGKIRQFPAETASIRADPANTQQLLARLFRCLSPRQSCHAFITYPSCRCRRKRCRNAGNDKAVAVSGRDDAHS